MTRSALRWLRRTLPPTWAIVVAAVVFAFWEGLYLWLRHAIGIRESVREMGELLRAGDAIALVIMAVYGVFRVAAFHPVFRKKYRGWLEQTPWTSRKPLPLGPIHLVWQDLLILGVVTLALYEEPAMCVLALAAFFFAYLGIVSLSFWATEPWCMGYVVLFGLGLAVRLAANPMLAVMALLATYVLAMIGLRKGLARFPWPESKLVKSLTPQLRPDSAARREPVLGWPYGQLAGAPPGGKVRRRDGILGPLLAAWWAYAIISNVADIEQQPQSPASLFLYLSAIACVVRLFIYLVTCRPPISLRGRIATGHWVIPGYDYVLLTPLATLLVGLIGFGAVVLAGPAWTAVSCPLAGAAILIAALNTGPSLRKWQLTGHHRITPGGTNDASRVRL